MVRTLYASPQCIRESGKGTTLYQIVWPHVVPQASCGKVQRVITALAMQIIIPSDLGQMGLKYGAG